MGRLNVSLSFGSFHILLLSNVKYYAVDTTALETQGLVYFAPQQPSHFDSTLLRYFPYSWFKITILISFLAC